MGIITAKEIEVDAETLSNAAYSRLSDLMEGDLGMSHPGIEAANEAEILIKILKYVAEKSPFILLKISYVDCQRQSLEEKKE